MSKKQPIITKKEPVTLKKEPVLTRTSIASTTGIIFKKENYTIMLSGIGVLILGFIIMALDKEPYGFGFLGLTLGPVVLAIGFAIQFWAIFYKTKRA